MATTLNLSKCHFAEVMEETIMGKHLGAKPEYLYRCSYCGNKCSYLVNISTVGLDLELTLRRWKDGDCSLDDMFDRLRKELDRVYSSVVDQMRLYLQKGSPKYKYELNTVRWVKVNDLVKGGSDDK